MLSCAGILRYLTSGKVIERWQVTLMMWVMTSVFKRSRFRESFSLPIYKKGSSLEMGALSILLSLEGGGGMKGWGEGALWMHKWWYCFLNSFIPPARKQMLLVTLRRLEEMTRRGWVLGMFEVLVVSSSYRITMGLLRLWKESGFLGLRAF